MDSDFSTTYTPEALLSSPPPMNANLCIMKMHGEQWTYIKKGDQTMLEIELLLPPHVRPRCNVQVSFNAKDVSVRNTAKFNLYEEVGRGFVETSLGQ